jgi:hypothetical protein
MFTLRGAEGTSEKKKQKEEIRQDEGPWLPRDAVCRLPDTDTDKQLGSM